MRPFALTVLATTALLTACEGEKPAPPAETTKAIEPAKPTVDVATLPGATVPVDATGTEYSDGVRGWMIVAGSGEMIPTKPTTATVRLRGWTVNGEQFFGDAESWDELVLPTGDAAAFGGWASALTDMKIGEVRKVWFASEGRDTWPVAGANPKDLVLDIELVSIGEELSIPEVVPGVAIGDASRHGSSSGLRWYDLTAGQGKPLASGDTATVTAVAWLEDGTLWQDSGRMPFVLTLDETAMPALREGLMGMTPGSTRKLIVPPMLGGGFDPMGDLPPGTTLIMDVQYVGPARTADATAE
jgi:FKBP-type peptidyl-prolyl cis-trans isomerase